MLIVRATKKLRDRIGPADLGTDERSTTALGEWYATRFAWRPDVLVAAEFDHMKTRRIGATANRSVVGIMTEFSFLVDVHRTRNDPDLDDLAAQLATTPCSPLYRSHISPDRAFTALLHSTAR